MGEIVAIVETSVYVDDLDRAETFYREILGLEVLTKEPGRHVFFRVGDGMLLIFDPRATIGGGTFTSHGAVGPGHFGLGVRTEDLDGWRVRLEDLGVTIEDEVRWPRGGRSIYFRDPAGNSVELITPGVWGLPAGW